MTRWEWLIVIAVFLLFVFGGMIASACGDESPPFDPPTVNSVI